MFSILKTHGYDKSSPYKRFKKNAIILNPLLFPFFFPLAPSPSV